jgi:serine/threonine protein kinase
VKPSNLMVTGGGVVKLLDLGLAVFVSVVGRADERITGPTVLGTQDYMAPEQWVLPGDVTDRADVYGLGCVVYQALAGRTPFGGREHPGVADRKHAHLFTPPPDLRPLRPDCPPRLVELIDRTLAKRPDQRPSAAELSRTLAEFVTLPNRLPKLVELARLGTGFRDGEPTALAPPPADADADATRLRAAPSEPAPNPLSDVVVPHPAPVVPPPAASPVLFVFVLAVLGAVLLGGLVFIAAGGLGR